ncbi:MAG: hypothetical protein HY290_24285 [Planctomycetia bacterium]|nr:hypothetical protein [Planctomycetia bacterium]
MSDKFPEDKLHSLPRIAGDFDESCADDLSGESDANDDSVTIDSAETADSIVIPFIPAAAAEQEGAFQDQPAPAPMSDEQRNAMCRARLWAIADDLESMIEDNRNSRPASIYAGFLLVAKSDGPIPEEQEYAGTLLPLHTAQRYPELLAFESLEYAHAYSNETLPEGTRQIVRPGKFQAVRSGVSRWRWVALVVTICLVGAAAAGLYWWMNR